MGYILVNPRLDKLTIKSKQKNSTDAAQDIWSQLSENIKNYIPEFYFTIQNASNSKLSHYVVKESMTGGQNDDNVDFVVKEFKGKKVDESKFIEELNQEGGKKHRHRYNDDDSSSSSSSSERLLFTFPAGRTLTYYPTIYGVPNVLLPTFTSPFSVLTNIRLLPNTLIITP